MSIPLIIISFVVILFITLSLHELGHFITARRCGVKMEEFGFGYPPRLFGVRRGETLYSINAIPIGAFVKSVGEDDPTVTGSLASKGPWARLSIYAAGPVVNILLAFVFFSAFFMVPTDVIAGNGVMVHYVEEGWVAEEAGIEVGDVILEMDGQTVRKWGDLQNIVAGAEEGEEMTLLLQKDGGQEITSLIPEYDPLLERRRMGIIPCWNVVAGVEEGSVAAQAGIMPGDTVMGVNRQAVYSGEGVADAMGAVGEGEAVELILYRGREEAIVVSANVTAAALGQSGLLGADLHWVDDIHIEQEQLSPAEAAFLGADFIIRTPEMIAASIPLLREDPSKALVGPIGAGQLTIEAVKSTGFSNVLLIAGVISLGIALFNFLPIPPLDGGGMLVAVIEGFRRGKKLSPRALHLVYTIGTAFLITLMIMVTFSDILRLYEGRGFGL